MRELLGSLIRLWAFVRKEAVDILRQPRLVVTLVVGPFLILAAFGAGLLDRDPPMATTFVAPSDDEVAEEVVRFARGQEGRLDVREVTTDEDAALRQLRTGQLDMVVVFPEDAEQTVQDDEQAEIVVYHNLVDPIETRAMELFVRTAVDEVNQQVLRSVVSDGQRDAEEAEPRVREARERAGLLRAALEDDDERAAERHEAELRTEVAVMAVLLGPALGLSDGQEGGGVGPELSTFLEGDDDVTAAQAAELEDELADIEEGLARFRSMSPTVIVSPFRGTTQQVGSGGVELADFYAPAVLIVLLQHLVVTFMGLSLVRDAELGTNELFRTSPIRPSEVLAGKSVAYLLIGGGVAVGLLVLLVGGLGTPLLGPIWVVAAIVAAVLLASIALGSVVALISSTDSQAVQYSMLLLLATIFFSGFLLDLGRFLGPLRGVAHALPATHGIQLLRDAMLRGQLSAPMLLVGLAVMALVLYAVAAVLLRRRLRGAGV